MGNKKPFINRKEALKFSIVQRSVRDPLINNPELGENVFKPVGSKHVPVEEMEERIKYGIYYDDDYNYLTHLKSRDEIVGDDVETEIVLAPNVPKKKDAITLSSSLFETKGLEFKKDEEKGGLVIEELDDDVMAALDERYDFNDPDNELEDDLFQEIIKGGPVENMKMYDKEGDDGDYDDDDEEGYELSSNGEDYENDMNDNWDDTKTRFTNYSMSSAVIKRENGLSTLDEKFETFYAEYDDDKIAEIPALEASDVAGFLETDDRQFKELMEDVEFKMPSLPKQKISEKEREMAHRAIIGDDEPVDYTKIKVEPSKYKKQQWDVESITSTYSNIYNHPRPILETSRKRIRNKTESSIVEDEEMEMDDSESIMSGVSTLSVRPKGETPEERKLRKQAVKEQQRNRRKEKKLNKLAFKDEKKLMDARNSVIQLKARKIC